MLTMWLCNLFAVFNKGYTIKGIHTFADPISAVNAAQCVYIGGGNTFVLMKKLHELNLIEPLKKRVAAGMPFMGSSAGSNLATVSISTTNDMPIVYPPTLVYFLLANTILSRFSSIFIPSLSIFSRFFSSIFSRPNFSQFFPKNFHLPILCLLQKILFDFVFILIFMPNLIRILNIQHSHQFFISPKTSP